MNWDSAVTHIAHLNELRVEFPSHVGQRITVAFTQLLPNLYTVDSFIANRADGPSNLNWTSIMPQIHIPALLRTHVDNQTVVKAAGSTVDEVLQQLFHQYPELEPALMSQPQKLHPSMNLFIDETNIRDLQQLASHISPHQSLLIVPALAGG